MGRKTRKVLTIYRALHPEADVYRLYFPRSKGERGVMSVEECVAIETKSLSEFVSKSKEQALCAVSQEGVLKIKDSSMDKTVFQKQRFDSKSLHGDFFRATEEDRDKRTWDWLRKGRLKRETEGFVTATQDQALETNRIKHRIDKQDIVATCRMCGQGE